MYLASENVTQAAFASRLGVTQSMVGHWIHGRARVVAERARQIEAITFGLIRASELRPDIFGPPPAENADNDAERALEEIGRVS